MDSRVRYRMDMEEPGLCNGLVNVIMSSCGRDMSVDMAVAQKMHHGSRELRSILSRTSGM